MRGIETSEFDNKMIMLALLLTLLTPIFFVIFVPMHNTESGESWDEEISNIEQTYYAHSGGHSTPEQVVWTLTGIYEPFSGGDFGHTEDGWIYGNRVTQYTPSQYDAGPTGGTSLTLVQAKNGLWYYYSHPSYMLGIHNAGTTVDGNTGKIEVNDTTNKTVYSAVYMDESHVSNVFFTSSTRQENDDGYWYAYSGYRYAFQPLTDYFAKIEGNGSETVKVNANSTSLSLIWYKYSAGVSGLAGQLAISGTDRGVSYLTADDIIREFNSSNYSSTFDMTFNSVKMHLVIRLDANKIAEGTSIRDCYDNGYWSVMVYSDAVVDSVTSSTFEFSIENIFNTLLALFTFRVAEQYDVEGWVGTIASLFISMPLYCALLSICLKNAHLLILLALVTAVQALLSKIGSISNWWPF